MIPYGRVSGHLMAARQLLNRHDPGRGPTGAVAAAIRLQLDTTIWLTRQAHHRQHHDR